jgi:ribosomal protein L9
LNRFVLIAALCGLAAFPALAQNLAGSAKPSGLPDAEKLQKSAESLEKMKSSLKSVLTRVEEARNEKDVVKLNCVNEKLTQVKGLLKVAEQSDIALHEAISNKDPAAESEFAKIGIAKSKVDGLRNDADQCIGQLAYIVDEKTTVEVQQPLEPGVRAGPVGTVQPAVAGPPAWLADRPGRGGAWRGGAGRPGLRAGEAFLAGHEAAAGDRCGPVV